MDDCSVLAVMYWSHSYRLDRRCGWRKYPMIGGRRAANGIW